jgi:uncharacterized coiled-coil protein SlyX
MAGVYKTNKDLERFTTITSHIQDITTILHSEFNIIYSNICDKMVDIENVKTGIIKLDSTIREQHIMINNLDDVCTEIKSNIKSYDERIDKLEETVKEQGIIITEQGIIIKEQKNTIDKLEETVKEQGIIIKEQKNTIDKLEETVKEQGIIIKEQGIIIKEQGIIIKEQNKKIVKLETRIDKLIYRNVLDKIIIAIQDLNAVDELEKKFRNPYKEWIRELRLTRNAFCHYMDKENTPDIINKKKEILLRELKNTLEEYSEKIQYDVSVIHQVVQYLEENCCVYDDISDADIRKIELYWE